MSHPKGSAVLVGVPGTGSTSVGRAVAERLGWELRDTERLAAAALGFDTVGAAFVTVGEEAFQAAESEVALAELAALRGDASAGRVLVLGSGVLASPQVRAAAASANLIELTVTLAHAAPRLGLSLARPVFLGNPRAQWARLAAERRAAWADVVVVVIDTDDATIDEAASRVIDAIGQAPEREGL